MKAFTIEPEDHVSGLLAGVKVLSLLRLVAAIHFDDDAGLPRRGADVLKVERSSGDALHDWKVR